MIALLLLACNPATQSDPAATPPAPAPPAPAEPLPDVGTQTVGEVESPDSAPPYRVRRRMDISQLDASIRRATGGFGWDSNGRNQFEELADTLAVPDYVDRTAEDLSAGLLFQKFLDDAANSVCQDLVEAEFAGTSDVFLTEVAPEDTSLTNPVGVDATLSNAVLRFHGYRLAPDDPQLDSWRFLFDSTLSVTDDDTMAAWRAVCIGLIVHPDFYQY